LQQRLRVIPTLRKSLLRDYQKREPAGVPARPLEIASTIEQAT
jgi:hypothetical protein